MGSPYMNRYPAHLHVHVDTEPRPCEHQDQAPPRYNDVFKEQFKSTNGNREQSLIWWRFLHIT